MRTLILSPRYTPDSIALREGAAASGWDVMRLQSWRAPEELRGQDVAIYGEPLFAAVVAAALGLSLIEPRFDWLATLPAAYTRRAVGFTTLGEARSHQGAAFIKPADDRQHLQRYHKFKKVFQQLHQWIETGNLNRHTHDVELDINDTKALLQDFLGQAQHIEMTRTSLGQVNPEFITATTKQLLEYLYLFGHFFHSLDMTDPDQRQLRRRFLFADQYFDSVEVILSGN